MASRRSRSRGDKHHAARATPHAAPGHDPAGPPFDHLGMKLRALRTARKSSQAALAERAGFGREYVNKIEASRYDPPLSTLNSLVKAPRVKIEELLRCLPRPSA